jgi:serine/threonine-protein kinase HipA
MGDLAVDLYGARIGKLIGDWRTFDLTVDHEALRRFGLDSSVLSLAIPLSAFAVASRRVRRQNFFRELLPEGRMLTQLARQSGHDEHDVIGLLRNFGRDIAGALQIWDPELPGEPRIPGIEPQTSEGVADMLREVQQHPLGNRLPTGKTSLAGVQDKIVLAFHDGGWNRVIDGWPSTHILKPESNDFPSMIYDEEYGSRFARALGLSEFETRIETFSGVPALVIRRYDRRAEVPGGRLHQEDFNQILGATGIQKYQRFGGRVSFERIAKVLVVHSDGQALEQLFKLMVLSVAVGNLDLHAKNISVLHFEDGSISLAPAYDVVPQAHLPNDGQVAIAINGKYFHSSLAKDDLIAEGASWGFRRAASVVESALESVFALANLEAPHDQAGPSVQSDIIRTASNLLSNKLVGAP